MIVLGLTDPLGNDNAAAILVDGELVGMVEEERLSRIKHAPSTAPLKAIDWCLAKAGCTLDDVDVVAIGHDSPNTVVRQASASIVANRLRRRPAWRSLRDELRSHRMHRYAVSLLELGLRMPLQGGDDSRVMWVRHHMAHAASAYYFSGFEEANVISLDGLGGQDSGLLGVGRGNNIDVLRWVERETSWGNFYEEYTGRLGFRMHSDEGKVMGLAAYGDSGNEIFPYIDLDGPDGFPCYDKRHLAAALAEVKPRRREENPINGYHEHVAARLQYSLEQVMRRITEVLHERTGLTDFCLAGGTALNCSSNGKLVGLPHVKRLFVQPAAGDSGTALGAAAYAHVRRTGKRPSATFDHAYWGPSYSNDEIRDVLDLAKASYREVDDVGAATAGLLAENKIVGWFQGRMEIGPRALGARSILANPTDVRMKDQVNKNVKFREPWRPFAPSILRESIREYFGTDHLSPFMILAYEAEPGIEEKIPAALHVDRTGRPQTVDRATNPRYWSVIDEFRKLTGVPVVLNTSFNVDSEPIVCSPKNALATFAMSGLDALAIGDFIVEKNGSKSRKPA
jgi:carbamoyltransferase